MTFRKQLIAERERLNLTQAECAKVLGVSVSSVAHWEVGSIKPPRTITQEGALARLGAMPSVNPEPDHNPEPSLTLSQNNETLARP